VFGWSPNNCSSSDLFPSASCRTMALAGHVLEFVTDRQELLPLMPSVSGTVALATRKSRLRHASVHSALHVDVGAEGDFVLKSLQPEGGIHGQGYCTTATKPRHASLRSLRKGTAPRALIEHDIQAARLATPPSFAGRRRFRTPSHLRLGMSGMHELHAHPPTADANLGEAQTPHPPSGPKPEKGLRPRLRDLTHPPGVSASAPEEAQDTDVASSGQHSLCASSRMSMHCCSGTSLVSMMALSQTEL